MDHSHNIELLNEAIETAEKVLVDIEDDDSGKAKRKRKRINKALEHAYATLNTKEYTNRELDKRTDEIWKSLIDDDHFLLLLIFFFGFTLSGAVIFTVFQAYSMLQDHWDPEITTPPITEEVSDLIEVNYKEENIVSFYDQMTVSDEKGLMNTPEEFTISNSSKKVGGLNYLVHYYVQIVPLNDPTSHTIDKRYIKYRYSYKDSNGKTFESPIGTLADLTEGPDGTLLLTKGTQKRDEVTDFKINFWLSSHATNDNQGGIYTFQFKVDASIARG